MACHLLTAFCWGGHTVPCPPGALSWIIWSWDVFLSLLFIWSYACSELLIKRLLRARACHFPKIKSLPWRLSETCRIDENESKDPGNLEFWVPEETINMSLSLFGACMGLNVSFWVWNWERPPWCEMRGPSSLWGTSLVVHWLRLWASNAEGTGSIPGWGNKIPHARKKERKKKLPSD